MEKNRTYLLVSILMMLALLSLTPQVEVAAQEESIESLTESVDNPGTALTIA
ncbi:MAG: hypothetical protein U9N12_06075 [Euryarchaeota archaeon]|nr:hypothetical protein [Euryarchaeota archaeon]